MTHSVAKESGEVVKGRTTANPGPGPEQGRAGGQGNRQVQSDQRQPSPRAALTGGPLPPADSRRCKKTFRQCSNGRCVPNMLWCNGADDCGDGSDEIPCNSEWDPHFCPTPPLLSSGPRPHGVCFSMLCGGPGPVLWTGSSGLGSPGPHGEDSDLTVSGWVLF